jgi:putative transposase
MNPPKYTDLEYINFLIATQKVYSCSEAERVQPHTGNSASHNAINRLLPLAAKARLLHRIEPEPEQLWQEAKADVELTTGILVLDDMMMDKWFAQKIELVSRQWSGRHKRVVRDAVRSYLAAPSIALSPTA